MSMREWLLAARWNTGLKWLGCAVLVSCAATRASDDALGTPDALAASPARTPRGEIDPEKDVTVDVELVAPAVVPAPVPHDAEPAPSLEPVEPSTEPSASNECSDPYYPAPSWSPGAWVPYPRGEMPNGVDAQTWLDAVQSAMPGSRHGIATTPWTNPYEVDLRFDEGGGYSSRCSSFPDSCCVAFYYGTNDDTPLKQWRVDDATLSGDVFGEIDIALDYFTEYGLPAWQGELSYIERDASGDGMRFEFARDDGYGPVRFDLRRVQ